MKFPLRSFYVLFIQLVWTQTRNTIRFFHASDLWKLMVLSGFAGGVVWSEYALYMKIWQLLGAVPFGYPILIPRLLSWLGSFLFAFLTYSSFLTALSSLFRSDDIPFLLSTPISPALVLFHKWKDTAFRSGATLIFLAIPPMIALGITLHRPPIFYLVFLNTTLAFAALAVTAGVWIAMTLVILFPVKRMHQTAALLGLGLAALLITVLRFLHLENLWSEQALSNPLLIFLGEEPSAWSRFLPGQFFAQSVTPSLANSECGVWFWGILLCGSLSIAATMRFGTKLFLRGWRKNQEQADPYVSASKRRAQRKHSHERTGPMRSLLWKDWVLFRRDPAIWTQLFMMIPLAALYLLNLSFLPVKTKEILPFFAVANVGFVGLIIAAIGARFLFPAASREGRAVWIPCAAPVSAAQMIGQKTLLSVTPVLGLAAILLEGSALILQLSAAWSAWCLVYGMIVALLLCLLAVFLGFCFPMYGHRHLLEVSLGSGSFLYMVIAVMTIASLEYVSLRAVWNDPTTPLPLLDSVMGLWLVAWTAVSGFCLWRGASHWGVLDRLKN